MVRALFDIGIIFLIARMIVDLTLPLVAVTCFSEVNSDALGSYHIFSYESRTGKLSRLNGSAPIARKLPDGTKT